MRWLELLSAVRLGSKKSSTELARSPFHKDYDRIIFSQSFRQLNRKTQFTLWHSMMAFIPV